MDLKVGLAQVNSTVGDFEGNAERILAAYRKLVAEGARLVATPEMALTGYPPQDLVFKSRFVPRNNEVLDHLERQVGEVPLIVGCIDRNTGSTGQPFRNAAAVLRRGSPRTMVYKTLLPTYDVFDEERYYEPADSWKTIEVDGRRVAVTVCEDIWPPESLPHPYYANDPVRELLKEEPDLFVNLSASPYHAGKCRQRLEMLQSVARRCARPLAYCNAVGGNDELVFDGCSVVLDERGRTIRQLPAFEEAACAVPMDSRPVQPAFLQTEEEILQALQLGLHDYFRKCGFQSAVIGLSGGIDSALTACIAARALGAENITGITMPSRYSSEGSVSDSEVLARNLGIGFLELPVTAPVGAFHKLLSPAFKGTEADTTEENIQPRVRSTILMAFSNKFGHLLLSTGNKSELAVGYCTLYGDMAGGLAVISDVPKTMVYRIARHINREREIIPWNTIRKPPSAELKPDQVDQDTLPPYEVLDAILERYVEEHRGFREIVADGFDEETVRWVQRRVDLNEYKRKQAAPGLRVTSKAFGSGRRMPVAQRFLE